MKRLPIAVLLLMLTVTAFADESEGQWRVGASLAYSDFDNSADTNDGGVGLKAFAQFKANHLFGVEGAFYTSPEFQGNLTPGMAGGETEITYQGGTLHALGYLPSFSERIDLFVKGGYFSFYDVNLKVNGQTADSGSDDGLALGLGVSIDAAEDIGIRVEFDWYDTAGADLWTIGIGAEYRF